MAAIDKLKCGGKTKGRKKDGGIIKSRVPKMQEGGTTSVTEDPTKPGFSLDVASGIAEMATELTDTIFNARKQSIQSGYDNREDPTKILGKSNRLDTGKVITKGAATGASIGTAILPGIGTAIGAVGGALVSGIGRLIGKKNRDREVEEAQQQWSSGWTDKAAAYANQAGYKEGGRIKGKGGSRSDSIKMTAEDGSFIVPVENAETGMDIGKEYLGWNDKTLADRKNRGTELKVSDGEIFYTPEEVGILKYYGVNIDELAPNAKPEHKMKDGGSTRKEKRMAEFKATVGNTKYDQYLNSEKGIKQEMDLPDNLNRGDFDNYLNYAYIYNRGIAGYPQLGRRSGERKWENYQYDLANPGKQTLAEKKSYGKYPFLDKVIDSRLSTRNIKRAAVKTERAEFEISSGVPSRKFQKGGNVSKFQEGGWKYDKETGRVVFSYSNTQYDQEGNEYRMNTSGKFELSTKNTTYGRSIFSEYSGLETEKEEKEEGKVKKRNFFDYIPEMAGTIQALGGAYGLIEAGKEPDLRISHTLKKLSAETRRLANFGYEPAVLNALNVQIERSRRDMSKRVTSGGGSPMENMEKLKMILSTSIDRKAGIIFQDAKEKTRKWADVIKVDTLRAGQEFDVNKIDLSTWYKTQDAFSSLLAAGIENIVGARQLKDQQDVLREIGPTNPTFTHR